MIYNKGQIFLEDIVGGSLLSGNVPFARITHDWTQFTNIVDVTVVAAGNTTIVDTGNITCSQNERAIVMSHVVFTKGGVAGDVGMSIIQTGGTGVFTFETGTGNFAARRIVGATAVEVFSMIGCGRITTGGTINLRLQAFSLGSDSTVTTGQGNFWPIYFKVG
jgi:hypothetical protein